MTARRLQLVHNADGDTSTVQIADCDAALASPARFTEADVDAFRAIKDQFQRRATTLARAVIAVSPDPGISSTEQTIGQLRIFQETVVSYEEDRVWGETRVYNGDYSVDWHFSFDAYSSVRMNASLPAGVTAVLISEADGEESLVEGALQKFQTDGGTYTIEFWQGGTRTESRRVNLPTLRENQSELHLNQYVDYEVETTSGALLTRNLVSGTHRVSESNPANEYRPRSRAHFSYDMQMQAPAPPNVLSSDVILPQLGLPHGRFQFTLDGAPLWIDLFPQGIVRATHRDRRTRCNLYQGIARSPNFLCVFPYPGNEVFRLDFDGRLQITRRDANGGHVGTVEFRLSADNRIG